MIPSATGTEKKLVSFQGEYRKGKQTLTYLEPLTEHQDAGIDGELIQDLTEDLVNDKHSRDGIPHELFPLRTKDLPAYNFTMKGELEHQGRRTYRIGFEPVKKKTAPIAVRTKTMTVEITPGWAKPGSTLQSSNLSASTRTWLSRYPGLSVYS